MDSVSSVWVTPASDCYPWKHRQRRWTNHVCSGPYLSEKQWFAGLHVHYTILLAWEQFVRNVCHPEERLRDPVRVDRPNRRKRRARHGILRPMALVPAFLGLTRWISRPDPEDDMMPAGSEPTTRQQENKNQATDVHLEFLT